MMLQQSNHCLYPYIEISTADGYPSNETLSVIQTDDGRGAGIAARKAFKRGEFISRVSGHLLSTRRLHTLQINDNVHLYDPYFSGLLLHSCDPNVLLNMADLELWALKDIAVEDLLTMDYASTEHVLMRQFQCQCGAPNCRGWITGSKEVPQVSTESALMGELHSPATRTNPVPPFYGM
jgi:hypothetical protein